MTDREWRVVPWVAAAAFAVGTISARPRHLLPAVALDVLVTAAFLWSAPRLRRRVERSRGVRVSVSVPGNSPDPAAIAREVAKRRAPEIVVPIYRIEQCLEAIRLRPDLLERIRHGDTEDLAAAFKELVEFLNTLPPDS